MKIYGILGKKLGHTFSPLIHGMLGDYAYQVFENTPEELDGFLKGGDFAGLNVTIPYKLAVIPYCAQLSETARQIGSVNTLVRREDGTLFGDNTDYYGLRYMVEKSGVSPAGEKAIVLGSGGASLTAQAVLRDMGAREVVTISRSGPENYENLYRHYDAGVIVNTTPVGMFPGNGAAPVDISAFSDCKCLYELIYNPARTKLMQDAERCGIQSVGGLKMLVAQAKKAAEIYLDTRIDDSRIEEIEARIERMTKNVMLIGMPGCGKTTVGRCLAGLTGRDFVDLDEEVEKTAGKTIPQIFAEQGEAAFRRLETEVLEQFSKLSGKVIATGGGVVTRGENRDLLRQNSTVVFLNSPISALAVAGRPVSQSTPLEVLYAARMPNYLGWSDLQVECADTEVTAKEIQNKLKLTE